VTPQAPESNEDVSNATGTRGGTASVWQGGSKFGGSITLTTGGKLRFGNSVKGTHNDAQIRQEGSEFTPKVVGGRTAAWSRGIRLNWESRVLLTKWLVRKTAVWSRRTKSRNLAKRLKWKWMVAVMMMLDSAKSPLYSVLTSISDPAEFSRRT
jgi:hypothetical protein